MAAAGVSQWRVMPGRAQEANALFGEAKVIHERLGARVRLFVTTVGGPNALMRTYVYEVDDLEAWGRITHAMAADAQWQGLVPRLYSADSPVTMIATSILNEVSI